MSSLEGASVSHSSAPLIDTPHAALVSREFATEAELDTEFHQTTTHDDNTNDKHNHTHHRHHKHHKHHPHHPHGDGHSSSDDDGDLTEDLFRPMQILRSRHRRLARECSPGCWIQKLKGSIPALTWLPKYPYRTALLPDALAGLMMAVVSIPQGMAYAVLAGLPPIIGLYSCLIPPLTYAFLGCSPDMHIGPFALTSLLVGTSLAAVTPADAPVEYIQDSAFIFSIMVGLLLILMSILRLGFAVSFLADCVLSAFTCASAFLILTSQWKAYLGLNAMPSGMSFVDTHVWVFEHLGDVNGCSLIIGIVSTIFLFGVDEFNARMKWRVPIPSQLLAVVLSIIVVWAGRLDTAYGIKVVGSIPSGLPSIAFPGVGTYITDDGRELTLLTFANIKTFMQPVCTIALISYIISISIGKNFATKTNEARAAAKARAEAAAVSPPSIGAAASETIEEPINIDANQELFALGVANVFGGLVASYPSAGSLSRSALVHASGVKSTLHNVVSVILLVFVLLVLTPTLYYLPSATLAAIVCTALKGLMLQVFEAKRLYGLRKQDFLMWISTFIATIFFDTQVGIAIGLLISLLMLLKQTSRPPVSTLGRLEGTDLYRDVKRFHLAQTFRRIVIFRFDAPLHFANKDFFRQQLLKHLEKSQEREWRKVAPPEYFATQHSKTSNGLGVHLRKLKSGVVMVGKTVVGAGKTVVVETYRAGKTVHKSAKKLAGHVGGHMKRAGQKMIGGGAAGSRRKKSIHEDVNRLEDEEEASEMKQHRAYSEISISHTYDPLDASTNLPPSSSSSSVQADSTLPSDIDEVEGGVGVAGESFVPSEVTLQVNESNTTDVTDESHTLSHPTESTSINMATPHEAAVTPVLTRADCSVEFVIIDCASMIDLDDAALKMLVALPTQLGVSLIFSSLRPHVRDLLTKTHFFEKRTPNTITTGVVKPSRAHRPTIERPFVTVHQAVKYVLRVQREREAELKAEAAADTHMVLHGPTPAIPEVTLADAVEAAREAAAENATATATVEQNQAQTTVENTNDETNQTNAQTDEPRPT